MTLQTLRGTGHTLSSYTGATSATWNVNSVRSMVLRAPRLSSGSLKSMFHTNMGSAQLAQWKHQPSSATTSKSATGSAVAATKTPKTNEWYPVTYGLISKTS